MPFYVFVNHYVEQSANIMLSDMYLSLFYSTDCYYLIKKTHYRLFFASCVSVLKCHPINAHGCYSIGCQYSYTREPMYCIYIWIEVRVLQTVQQHCSIVVCCATCFVTIVSHPLWKIPDFKHSAPHQSVWSSNQKLELNLDLPLQLGTGERSENE